jgi:hypothetical protein
MKAMKWPRVASLNPWAVRRRKRLEQYLEMERHECRDAIDRHRKDRDQKERQVELDLFNEHREGSNWLENREIRMSALMLDYQRTFIAAQIDIRKKLATECPDLISDAELAKLQETMLHSVQMARQARRDDYTRRATAAGVPMRRPEQYDAAAYGDLQELAQREIRKLSLARSLGRIEKPSRLKRLFRVWLDMEPVTKALTAFIALATAVLGLLAAIFKLKK